MFDISFQELLLVFVVGLVVLGPQRLPVAIKTVMGWIRTIRGLAANVQNELAQELKLKELQESIKKAEALNLSALSPELSKTVEDLKQSAQQMQSSLNQTEGEIRKLTDEQVAEIQAKIAQEETAHSQNSQETPPLVAENAENNEVETAQVQEENTTSAANIAEMAELDEEKLAAQLSAYYSPDDFEAPKSEDKPYAS